MTAENTLPELVSRKVKDPTTKVVFMVVTQCEPNARIIIVSNFQGPLQEVSTVIPILQCGT